ncbi:MAG: chitobiase/beta-hexosaminidase C-terminal domain-containing protein [Proteobacteria bacterium]|nr:chitobiase/beta-hexosaminidase C-terminal domain-containing protein [Pseudomonadota bacterium]
MKTLKRSFVISVFLGLAISTASYSQNIEWVKSLGGTAYDNARSIQQTDDGGYIFTGGTNSNNGQVSGNHLQPDGITPSNDVWVVKLDSSGNIQWQKSLGGDNFDLGESIKQTKDNNGVANGYIIAGETASNNGDVSGNHGGIGYDAWIVRLDLSGNIIWQKCYGGSDYDYGYDIQQTTDGGYIFTGITWSADGDLLNQGYHGNQDGWVVKLDSSGNIMWQRVLGGSFQDWLRSIQQVSDGYIISGESTSNDGDLSGHHGIPGINSDTWLIKLNSSGNTVWSKSYGGTAQDSSYSVQQTVDSNGTPDGYISAGATASTDGDVSGKHGGTGFYAYDFWVIRVDLSGNLIWQKCLGGNNNDTGSSIRQTSDGKYIVAGQTHSNNGDVTGNHGGDGTVDAWVVKLDSSGNIIWQRCYGGNFEDWATSIIQTSNGGYIFGGVTASTNGDLQGVVTHGAQDAFIVKLTGVVLDPVFTPLNPPPSPTAISITITSSTPGAIIHYTYDGVTTPTCSNGTYGPSPLTTSTPGPNGTATTYVYQAIACETNWTASNVTTSTYVITGTVAEPVFAPSNPPASPNPITFTITDTTSGATIHYTSDGSTPTCTTGQIYSVPITLSVPGTYVYKAIGCETNWTDSTIATSTYVITDGTVPDPTFNPLNPPASTNPITFTIADTSPTAVIHYNVNSSVAPDCNTPDYGYSPITITLTNVGTYFYQAIACETGWTSSNVTNSTYAIIAPGVLPTPTFNPPGGTDIIPIPFVISDAEPGTTIHYNINSSTPPDCYSSPSGPSPLSLTTPNDLGTYVYKAIACEDGWYPSAVATATYTIEPDGIAPPVSYGGGKITIYPNPTHGFVTIKGTDRVFDARSYITVVVANSSGQTIYENMLDANNASVDLSNYPDGFYIIRIYGKDKNSGNSVSRTERIIKQ